jgi:hypothetical protein
MINRLVSWHRGEQKVEMIGYQRLGETGAGSFVQNIAEPF